MPLLFTVINERGTVSHQKSKTDICLFFSSRTFGTRVRIIGGDFEGQEGLFLKVKGARDRRVVIEVQGVIAVAMATIHPDLIEVIE